ncbi:arsenite efflux ATP-binding ArsA domain protein [Mycobacterium kansasii 662]|uniref:Arsenite efflux ATP-binding ArsA domain protein n=1 Tax=Mycobacterium kansasii 662 TaxID=1299326 RepID=X7XSX8_MYCKA|nr:arsenite efflux ATP-binding ArsA domain protein [Mycobacterium kansasii 662]
MVANTPNDGHPVGWPSRLSKARLHFVTAKAAPGSPPSRPHWR